MDALDHEAVKGSTLPAMFCSIGGAYKQRVVSTNNLLVIHEYKYEDDTYISTIAVPKAQVTLRMFADHDGDVAVILRADKIELVHGKFKPTDAVGVLAKIGAMLD